jgi:hypothetical protein
MAVLATLQYLILLHLPVAAVVALTTPQELLAVLAAAVAAMVQVNWVELLRHLVKETLAVTQAREVFIMAVAAVAVQLLLAELHLVDQQ